MTEVLRLRQSNLEQTGERIEKDGDSKVENGVGSTGTMTDDDLWEDLNVCMKKLENLPNDRKVSKSKETFTEAPAQETSTEKLHVLAEVQVKDHKEFLKKKNISPNPVLPDRYKIMTWY